MLANSAINKGRQPYIVHAFTPFIPVLGSFRNSCMDSRNQHKIRQVILRQATSLT